jgi:hypothetical protein
MKTNSDYFVTAVGGNEKDKHAWLDAEIDEFLAETTDSAKAKVLAEICFGVHCMSMDCAGSHILARVDKEQLKRLIQPMVFGTALVQWVHEGAKCPWMRIALSECEHELGVHGPTAVASVLAASLYDAVMTDSAMLAKLQAIWDEVQSRAPIKSDHGKTSPVIMRFYGRMPKVLQKLQSLVGQDELHAVAMKNIFEGHEILVLVVREVRKAGESMLDMHIFTSDTERSKLGILTEFDETMVNRVLDAKLNVDKAEQLLYSKLWLAPEIPSSNSNPKKG